jgi:subtilisin family serine protease
MFSSKSLASMRFVFVLLAYFGCTSYSGYTQSAEQSLYTGEIILKMKPDARHICLPDQVNDAQLKDILQAKGASWLGRWFPRHLPPNQEFISRSGLPPVDLSLMYQIKVTSVAEIPALCAVLKKHKLVAYAEPKILHPPLYNPSDTLADSLNGLQWQLRTVRAYQAWNIHQGDTNSFGGILDTGTFFDHIDLKGNEKYNELDTLDGLDNDGNGFVDDFRGWNYSENNNNPSWNWNSHGVRVIGAAFAKTDNVTLMAGNAFKCKYLPVKIYGPFNGAPFTGFEAIVYAADRGAKVINLSWGSELVGFLQYEQDIINYAAINRDVVVVAAAGNTAAELDFYPAAYQQVLSVGQTNFQDHIAPFSTWSTSIDLSAPSFGLPVLSANGSFQYDQGSSFGAPQVAAAALLLRSYRPHLNALQAAAQVRITADVIDTITANQAYRGKLGKGRLNMFRALADSSLPGYELLEVSLRNPQGLSSDLQAGDTVLIFTRWINRLKAGGALSLKLSTASPRLQLLHDSVTLNPTATGGTAQHSGQALRMVVLSNTPTNEPAILRFDLIGPGYADFAHHKLFLHPDFIRFDAGRLQVTLTSRGRNGHNDRLNTQGWGISFDDNQLAYESGLMIGSSAVKTSDVIRIDFFNRSNDFNTTHRIRRIAQPIADEEAICRFEDSSLSAQPLKLAVTQRAMRWDTADQVIVMEFTLENIGNDTLSPLYLGQFNDWDIHNYYDNSTFWDSVYQLAYARHNQIAGRLAGISWLYGGNPGFYGIDGFNQTPGGLNLTDQFSKSEKFQSLSSGIAFSGMGSNLVTDIQQVTSINVGSLAPGSRKRVALAYLADTSLAALRQAATHANSLYRKARQGPVPQVSDILLCQTDSSFTISSTNTQQLAVYQDSLGQQLIYLGPSFVSSGGTFPKRFWISNQDSIFPSPLLSVRVDRKGPFASIFSSKDTLIEGADTLLILQSPSVYNRWTLPSGDTLSGSPVQISYSQLADSSMTNSARITLFAVDSLGCYDTTSVSITLIKLLGWKGLEDTETIKIYPNPFENRLYVDGLPPEELQRLILVNTSGTTWNLSATEQNGNRLIIHLPTDLIPGLYLLRLEGKQLKMMYKLIKSAP